MGLRIKEQSGNGAVRPLTILKGFIVQVRHLSRKEIEDLVERCGGKEAEDAADEAAKAYLAGWSGLTPGIVRELGIPLQDDQPTTEGTIPFDREAARDLWRHALPARFAQPIQLFSHDILKAVELEKARAKNDSGASSAPSTTL